MARLSEYTWIFVVATIAAFVAAFGIGANDVANSFASSVGAKALTMPQALLIAAVCEFLGALLLGASVTDTIKSKIARINFFESTPDLFMYGMTAALITAAFWDNMACQLGLPVSTTHTIVGAVVGMSMAIRGGGAVVWSAEQDAFPYLSGMSVIFMSWAVSPLCAGICVTILFGLIRTFILRSKHSFARALNVLPVLVGGTFWLITSFIIQTGNKNKTWNEEQSGARVAWIGAVVGAGMGLITLLVVMPLIRRRILWKEQQASDQLSDSMAESRAVGADPETGAVLENPKGSNAEGAVDVGLKPGSPGNNGVPSPVKPASNGGMSGPSKAVAKVQTGWEKFKNKRWVQVITNSAFFKVLTYGARYKIHDVIPKNQIVKDMHDHAEVFDYNTESVFRYLQVFTAMVMSFAHGSNDVANAMGPFSAVYSTWNTSSVGSKANVPEWILAYGGAGIVLGLATFGYKILQVLGVKSVKLTNSRGFCVELATAITVVIASRYGLPVSTTQTVTGAVLFIGLFEGARGVNWWMFVRIFGGWVLTLVIAGLVSAAIASIGVYTPNKSASDAAVLTADVLQPQMLNMNQALFGTAQATNNVGLSQLVQSFNASLTDLYQATYHNTDNIVTLQSQIFPVYTATECANPAAG